MREHPAAWLSVWIAVVWTQGLAVAGAAQSGADETYLSNEEFKKLDRFDAHALSKADKIYKDRQYRQAGAEYESFLREFPKSLAVPYVVLRKARCLHKDDKRHEAIRQYDEVLDYFPNVSRYAAAALYYQGWAHWENGDEAKAMKCWAKMARDTEYRKHRLAATAINKLAENLAAKGHAENAAAYFWQVAVDFRKTNQQAANVAKDSVIAYYVRTSPNEPKLRQFYKEAHVAGSRPETTDEEVAKSLRHWNNLRRQVRRYGTFTKKDNELGQRYYAYWATALGGKFPKQDDYQIDVIAFQRAADGDVATWTRRLDELYARNHTSGDYGRVVKWIGLFHAQKAKVMEYYNRLVFSKMSNKEVVALVHVLFDAVRDPKMAKNAFGKLNLGKMKDDEKVSFARYLWDRNFDLVKDLCMSMQNKDRGRHELLLYYHAKHDAKRGVPMADQLVGVPEYAQDALWRKAELLEWSGKNAEAIAVYRLVNNPPSNLWRIAGCYERMGKTSKAITQLKEVEGFFKDHRAQAALRIAHVYRNAKLQKQCIAAYRRVLTKYPDTGESSDAHHQLEKMGITRIRGGIRDEKEDRKK